MKGVPSHRQRLLEIASKFGSDFADGILWGFSGVFRICKKTQVYFVSDSFHPVMVGYLTYFGTRLSCNPQFGQANLEKGTKTCAALRKLQEKVVSMWLFVGSPFIGHNMIQRCRETELVCFHSFFFWRMYYTFLVPST